MAKNEKNAILKKKLPFLSRYSHEIAHLATFFIEKTPIYFLNEHRLLLLFFSPAVLLVLQNWFKNVYFFNIFVKSCLYSNFYKAKFFFDIVKESLQIKVFTTIYKCYFLKFVL